MPVAFPYFAAGETSSEHWDHQQGESIQMRNVPTRTVTLADGEQAKVATVYDLMMANYGIDRGLGGEHVASSFDDENIAYTPAWQEKITGVPRAKIIQVAREFADNADKTRGKSMVIVGAAMNHWYHMDMNYRGTDQYADYVRLCWSKWWWLGPLCGTGKTASTNRLAAPGIWFGLESSTSSNEFYIILL